MSDVDEIHEVRWLTEEERGARMTYQELRAFGVSNHTLACLPGYSTDRQSAIRTAAARVERKRLFERMDKIMSGTVVISTPWIGGAA